MDRLQFIESIDQGAFVSSPNAMHFFDHAMAAYNIVGGFPGVVVRSMFMADPKDISLNIEFLSSEYAQSAYAKITNELHNRMDLYGKIFSFQSVVDNNVLGILIHQIN